MRAPERQPPNSVVNAAEYLTKMGVWDPDYWICAGNIANKIAGDWKIDDSHTKYGRRAITALCEILWWDRVKNDVTPPSRSAPSPRPSNPPASTTPAD
jgi:hypothetical protein